VKRKHIAVLVGVMVLLVAVVTQSIAVMDKGHETSHKMVFKAILGGYDRVPPNSTTASGIFIARVSQDETSLDYEVSYQNLTGDLTDLHLQFGQSAVNGGIIAHLCDEVAGCPLGSSGTITGHLDADGVDGPVNQGIAPGEFEEVLKAMRAGMTYVNAHSTQFPGGEIRGQVK